MKIPIPLRMKRKNKSHLKKKKRRRSLPAREKNLHLRKMMVTTMKIFRQPSPRNLKKHHLLHVTPNLLHPRRPRFKLASHPATSLPKRRKRTHLFHPLKNKLTKPSVHSSKTSSPQAKNRVSNPSLQVYYTPSVHPKTP